MVIYMRNETFKEEIDLFYSLIENAVSKDNPIDLSSIINFIHQGDFYLQGTSSSGLTLCVNIVVAMVIIFMLSSLDLIFQIQTP